MNLLNNNMAIEANKPMPSDLMQHLHRKVALSYFNEGSALKAPVEKGVSQILTELNLHHKFKPKL